MILQLLGLIAIFVFAFFVFRTASEYGRAAGLWTLAAVGIGIGFQWIVPVVIGIAVSIVLMATGTRPNEVGDGMGWWAFAIVVLGLALSFVGMFLVLRHVAKLPDEPDESDLRVPPPPTFAEPDDR